MPARVSILIPCYNARQWIAQAIESALAQTWPNKEVIVVDDGSTDGSLEVIRQFGDQIRWETGPNRGGNRARNRLLEMSEGEWLQYLDADDYLLPEKVEKQIEMLASFPKADVFFSPVTIDDTMGKELWREVSVIPKPHDLWILLALWYLPQTGALLWRKQAVVDVGGWKLDQPCCQEHELYLRLLKGGKHFVYGKHSAAVYRRWSEQTVCKRDVSEVHRRRLEIEQQAEDFLRQQNELTSERLQAINQGRFDTALMARRYDPDFAAKIMETVKRSQPGFIPFGPSAPSFYRAVFRLFGFPGAEGLRDLKQKIRMSKPEKSTAR